MNWAALDTVPTESKLVTNTNKIKLPSGILVDLDMVVLTFRQPETLTSWILGLKNGMQIVIDSADHDALSKAFHPVDLLTVH